MFAATPAATGPVVLQHTFRPELLRSRGERAMSSPEPTARPAAADAPSAEDRTLTSSQEMEREPLLVRRLVIVEAPHPSPRTTAVLERASVSVGRVGGPSGGFELADREVSK